MLGILDDKRRLCTLMLELSIMVDAGEEIVSQTYSLEGDGFLAPRVFGRMERVTAHVNRVEGSVGTDPHIPNVRMIAATQSIVLGIPEGERADFVINSCNDMLDIVRPGFDRLRSYLQPGGKLRAQMEMYKHFQMFDPVYFRDNITVVDDEFLHSLFSCFPAAGRFVSGQQFVSKLSRELDAYKQAIFATVDLNTDTDLEVWWRAQHHNVGLQNLYACARLVALYQSSSASAERVFSLYNNIFNDQQQNALEDYITTSVAVRYNDLSRSKTNK